MLSINEAEASYLFHLQVCIDQKVKILSSYFSLQWYFKEWSLTILMFLNCWVRKDDQDHKTLEILWIYNRKKISFPKYTTLQGQVLSVTFDK